MRAIPTERERGWCALCWASWSCEVWSLVLGFFCVAWNVARTEERADYNGCRSAVKQSRLALARRHVWHAAGIAWARAHARPPSVLCVCVFLKWVCLRCSVCCFAVSSGITSAWLCVWVFDSLDVFVAQQSKELVSVSVGIVVPGGLSMGLDRYMGQADKPNSMM